jgi:hypothetical protein
VTKKKGSPEMKKRLLFLTVAVLAISVVLASASYAVEKEGFGTKVKNFWKNLLGYPARVTEESASVLADTTKKGVSVVTDEVKRVADVTTGDTAKATELITEPIKGTADTAVQAVEGVAAIPSEAAKENTEAQAEAPAVESK